MRMEFFIASMYFVIHTNMMPVFTSIVPPNGQSDATPPLSM